MRKYCIGHSAKRTVIASIFLLYVVYGFLFTASADAKVYLDITSPALRKMPIAIFDLEGPAGREIAGIIRDDLSFTGLFMYIDKAAYIETLSQPFDPANWTPLGIEAVVKGSVQEGRDLNVSITLYDTFEGKIILKKQYQAEKKLIRPLSHSIANDIYKSLTEQAGIFRTKIAFVAEDKGGKSLYIMDWDGNRIKKLGLKGTLVLTPHWSPDGTKVVYSSERGRQWRIYMLNFITLTEKRIYISKGVNMAGDFFPSGETIAFSSTKKGTPDIYTLNTKNKKLKRITRSYGIEVSPTISPDGNLIAFVSDRGGSPQIYTMRSDGRDMKRVTFEGKYNTSPNWSPKGDRIVFSGRSGGRNQIFIVKPDGSELMQLTDYGNNEDPSFSPDGRYITFSSDRGRKKGIYIMRANGEGQKKITPDTLRAFGPRWSPN
jgi:TolB protein